MNNCKNCQYYDENISDGRKDMGQCRFNPPPWPVVRAGDWCGRHQAIAATAPINTGASVDPKPPDKPSFFKRIFS